MRLIILSISILFSTALFSQGKTINIGAVPSPNVGAGLQKSSNTIKLADSMFTKINANTNAQTGKQDSLNWFLPEKYGALGDGSTDDAAAFNAMQAAMPAGATVSLSSKTYALNSTWYITKGIKVIGSGIDSRLKCGVNNIVMIKVSADYVVFRDLFMYSLFTPTSGCAVRVDSSTAHPTPIAKFTLDNITINQFYNSIEAVNSYGWSITNCQISYINYGIKVSNTGTPDAGDSYISGCSFAPRGGFTGNTAIYQLNSGGLRIENNKFNYNSTQRYSYAYYGDISGTGDLIITGNSFENYTVNAIFLKGSTSYRFPNTTITGNQFAGLSSSTQSNIVIDTADNVSITGNVFTHPSSGSTDTSITMRSVNNVNVSNTYNSYPIPVYYYGTNTNMSGDGTGGLMFYQYTATQASAFATPRDGTIFYVTTTNGTFTTIGFWKRENGSWVKF